MKQVTPVIKRTRVRTEKFEVCPHCRKEIGEKESYVDPENYVYHRSCQDKGPIDHFEPMSADEFRKTFFRMNNKVPHQAVVSVPMQKTAGGYPVQDVSGSFIRNIAGTDYEFNWVGSIGLVKGDRSQDHAKVDKPKGMPDYMWFQIKDTIEGEALKAAVKQAIEHLKRQRDIVKASWLDRAGMGKTAQFADVDGPDEDFMDDDDDGHHVTAAKGGKKSLKTEGKPIDEALLADGLGAFRDVFVNYHAGKEGDKLAKWVIAICNDPKYAEVARKLEQFHGLMGAIYKDVVEIANQDESARGKVAAVLAKIKTAQAEKMGWALEPQDNPEIPNVINGYSYEPHGEFEAAMKEWQDQVSEGRDPATIGKVLYYEMIDWLDDHVSEEHDEDSFIYRIRVQLDENGGCIVEWPQVAS